MASNRNYWVNSSATRATTTAADTAPATANGSLTFTPNANKAVLLIAFATFDSSLLTRPIYGGLRDTSTDLHTFTCAPFATTDKMPVMFLGRIAASASPTSHTVKVMFAYFSGVGSGTPTVGCQDVTIFALEADTTDQYSEVTLAQAGGGLTTSATYINHPQAGAALTWTPGSAGAYVVLAACDGGGATGTTGIKMRLWDGTNAYCGIDNGMNVKLAGDCPQWSAAVLSGSLSGSQTWRIQYASAAANSVEPYDAVVMALVLMHSQGASRIG